jgi:hypothetical protein
MGTRPSGIRSTPASVVRASRVAPTSARVAAGSAASGRGRGASYCHSFVDDTSLRGWFAIGGTSLSSPLWSAVVDLAISYHGGRRGQANVMLYELFRSPGGYATYFHDITRVHQTETNKGWYPVRPDYDMATAIGTPDVTAITMAVP